MAARRPAFFFSASRALPRAAAACRRKGARRAVRALSGVWWKTRTTRPAVPFSRRSGARIAPSAPPGSSFRSGSPREAISSLRISRAPRSRRTSRARPVSRETVLRRLFAAPSPNAPVQTRVGWRGSPAKTRDASAPAIFAARRAARADFSPRLSRRASSANMAASTSAVCRLPYSSAIGIVPRGSRPRLDSEARDGPLAVVERLEDRIEPRDLEELLQVGTDSEELGAAPLVLRRRESTHERAETGRIHDSQTGAVDQKVDFPLFEQAHDGPLEHRLGIADHEIALHGHDRHTPILCRVQFHRALPRASQKRPAKSSETIPRRTVTKRARCRAVSSSGRRSGRRRNRESGCSRRVPHRLSLSTSLDWRRRNVDGDARAGSRSRVHENASTVA